MINIFKVDILEKSVKISMLEKFKPLKLLSNKLFPLSKL